jgi:osmoprotectant transport system substrate-binding protein
MRRALIVAGLTLAPLAAACGGSSSGGTAGAPVDDSLVVLADPQHLQNSDNIVAVVRKDADSPALETALNKVDTTLTQDDLVAMNKRFTVDHDTADAIAGDYIKAKGITDGLSGGSGKIVIGAANFYEQQVLAALYEQALDAAGFDTSVKDVESREVYEPALESGALDVMPEYAATLAEFLNGLDNGKSPAPIASTKINKTMAALTTIAAKHGLKPLEPSEATDQNAFAVRKDFASKWGLTTLADLTKVKGDLVLGGPPECPKRPYCQLGLEQKYGIHFTGFKPLDTGGPLTFAAITKGDVQVGLLFSSDPKLAG